MHSIPLPPFSETLQGLACVHLLLAWTLPGHKMKIWGEFISAEGQMEVFRECQNSKALLPSLFLLLFSVSICYLLLQVIAELRNSSCTHFCITDWLQEKKNKEKRSSLLHCFFSLRLWRSFALHRLIFPASDTAVTSLSPELCPPELSTFPLPISVLKQCPAFVHHFFPLTSISWEILLAETPSSLKTSSTVSSDFYLVSYFILKFPFVSLWQLCSVLNGARGSSGHWTALGLLHW